MSIQEAFELIEIYGYFPSCHGNTLYVDVEEYGRYLFYIDVENSRVDQEKLKYLLDTCQLA